DLMVAAMVDEGLSEEEARQRCWFADSKGLVVKGRSDLSGRKLRYAHDHEPIGDLQEVVEAMARVNERPIVFALSNPTSRSECTAVEAYTWTGGRAIFASGSPFDPVILDGKKLTPAQGNNVYIFPGLGMGAIACGARHVTEEMFFVAAKALASEVSAGDLE